MKFYPVSDQPFGLRPLKYLRENDNTTGTLEVHGPEIGACNTYDALDRSTTVAPTAPPTSTEPHAVRICFEIKIKSFNLMKLLLTGTQGMNSKGFYLLLNPKALRTLWHSPLTKNMSYS